MGRKKGYSPYYTHITYEELSDWVGRKTKIPVNKRWLASLMGEEFEESEQSEKTLDNPVKEDYSVDNKPKVEFTLTEL